VIADEQNTPKQLDRLAAQRQLYSKAKEIFAWQAILSGPIAVLTALLAVLEPSHKGYLALWGIAVTCSDLFWLTPWQRRLKDSAARVQEAFDCDVLQLPWNHIKTGKRPDAEMVDEHARCYEKRARSMPALTDWYPRAVDALPLHLARLICQRSNCWWDSKQRRRYAAILLGTVVIVFLIVFAVSLRGGLSLESFMIKVAAPLSPALVFGLRQFSEQRESAARLEKLKEHLESAWDNALGGAPVDAVMQTSRTLQGEIFENRRKSPPVVDALFKKLRTSYERQMNRAADEYVAQAKNALNRD
jgi:hypothetical protein